ncbi:DUF4272 domain-containing protein [Flagellimonas aurea]|uniref:DUF4272 domain-containing protein n=1 Tax=Flagellimonas aurea TaxID=2915619 RepID=UPI0035D01F0B
MKTSESRKIETNKYLESKGIPICEHLPLVENSQEVILRKPSEIASRIMILTGIIDTAFDEDRKEIVSWLKEINLWEGVSKSEKEYLTKKSLTKEDKIAASWRTEAVNVLYWSLGMVDKLNEPIEECDLTKAHEGTKEKYGSLDNFIKQSEIRSAEEILDQTDLIYRIHWAVRDAGLNSRPYPNGYNPSVVYERHYALNWITCYQEDWDDITTDT